METATTFHLDGGIARIVLDDGKANALSAERLGEIGRRLDAAEQAGAVVVLSGREGIFSAGFDLRTFKRGIDATVEMLQAGADLILRILAFPHPILTVCTGHAYPMGAFLMMAADVRFAAAGPWKIGMNEVAIGLTLPRFAVELARHRLSAPGFARVQAGAMYDPDEALRLGFIDRIIAADQLADAIAAEAARLRALDMPSFTATKARINETAIAAIRKAVAEDLPATSG